MNAKSMLWPVMLLVVMSLAMVSCPGKDSGPAALQVVRNETGAAGKTIHYAVKVTQAPQEVGAFGVEVRYDPALLRYTGKWDRGELTTAFSQVGVNEIAPGLLRVGGFTADAPVAALSTGALVNLEFEVVSYAPSQLSAANPVDDVKGFSLFVAPGAATAAPAAQ